MEEMEVLVDFILINFLLMYNCCKSENKTKKICGGSLTVIAFCRDTSCAVVTTALITADVAH